MISQAFFRARQSQTENNELEREQKRQTKHHERKSTPDRDAQTEMHSLRLGGSSVHEAEGIYNISKLGVVA